MATCVVLDTNIWRQTVMLKSNIGAALLFEMHRQEVRLGLPEVVEREIPRVLERHGVDLVNGAREHLRQLAVLMGRAPAPDPSLPSQDDIRRAVTDRIDEVDALLVRLPLTLEHARGALDRIMDKSSPFAKSQQYKDAAIWEAVLELAEIHDLYFVAGDKVFFDKDPSDGQPSPYLVPDVESRSREVALFWSLADCVAKIQRDAPAVDADAVVGLLMDALGPTLVKEAGRYGYEPGSVAGATIRPFVTEDPRALSIDFELIVELSDATGAERTGRTTAYGDCRFEPDANAVTDLRMDRAMIEIEDEEGRTRRHQSVYMRSAMGVGERQRLHRIRVPLLASESVVIEAVDSVTVEGHEEVSGPA